MGTLSIVATPIGNLEDITLRALRILKEVDYVLCEDTRITGKLLKHYDISQKLQRYDAHTSESGHERIINDLEGEAYCFSIRCRNTGVSDPGVLLITQARQAGIKTESIPGPSAVTAAVSLAGFGGNQFSFSVLCRRKRSRLFSKR